MNFYKHHIGDYAQATSHLSFVEDAAFSRLLRKYYAEEKPIPLDLKAAQRLVGARTREEKNAVETVLNEFFTKHSDGWHNKRADEELAEAQALEEERDGRRANEAERQRRHRERRKTLFDQLREHGIVPKFDEKTDALEDMLSRVTGRDGHEDVPVTKSDSSRVTGGVRNADATANQTPDTRHQISTPDRSQRAERSPSPDPEPLRALSPTAAGECCLACRRGGLMQTNPAHPALLAAIAEGATPEMFEHTAGEAVASGKGFAWVIATIRGRLADAARAPPSRPANTPHTAGPTSKTGQAILALENLKNGNAVDSQRNLDGPAAAALPQPRTATGR